MANFTFKKNTKYNTKSFLKNLSNQTNSIILSQESSTKEHDAIDINFKIVENINDVITELIEIFTKNIKPNYTSLSDDYISFNNDNIMYIECYDRTMCYYKIYGINNNEYEKIISEIKPLYEEKYENN